MVSPLPSQPKGEDTTEEVIPQSTQMAPAPTQQFLNGISPVAASRLSYYLTKENLGWSLLLLIAADYFGISNHALSMVGSVC